MHYIKQITTILLLALVALSVNASETNTYNRVTYQVTEQKEVNNDEITVTMSIEREHQDATKLSDEINQLIIAANNTIRKFPGVSSSSSDYSIRPVYSRDKRLDHWRGASAIVLKSQNSKEMATLVQVLQESMTIKSTRYSVSAERRETIHTAMIEAALQKFNTRAEMVSKGMGFKKYRLVNINISNSGNAPRPVYAMAATKAMSESIAAPTFDSGNTILNVTVSGTIEMEVAP